ncbi:ligand-gated ion channel 4-like [Anneissia japonica]|uniref:ligand-gated ion channel 4-like n=1 Tax=Anneissia japonica TaxID=1529436 RepID=UPI0014258B2D|nr:ligand-gated ion channel 4-like [Anneissia japonica]
MLRLYSLILFLTMSFLSVNSVTVSKTNETLITETLLNSLGPPTSRPVLDQSTVLNVSMSYVLTQIIELNDMLQELKVAGWFSLNWRDENINWNASVYGVNCVGIPGDSIWKPDLTLDNNVDEKYNQFPPNSMVQICSNGSATFSAYSIFRSSCHISIRSFPYDEQLCSLRFSSWIHDLGELDIHPQQHSLDQEDQFDDNGIWRLIHVQGTREVEEYKSGINPYVYAVISIQLMRRHHFQLLFILIPYCFCSFLICLMFFVPTQSGEKLSYGMTAVLGMIVFQDFVTFSLPPIGNESTIIGKYIVSVIGLGYVSLLVEIMVTNIHMQGNVYKTGVYLQTWYRIKMAEFSPKQPSSGNQTEEPQPTQDGTATAQTETEYVIQLQHNCAVFDFYFGILCVALLFMLLIWFYTVI